MPVRAEIRVCFCPPGRVPFLAMRLIVARCAVDYTGRLTTHLPEAVRLIMIKNDGGVSVWHDGGSAHKPQNCDCLTI
jgi:RecB family endonuclease NucS